MKQRLDLRFTDNGINEVARAKSRARLKLVWPEHAGSSCAFWVQSLLFICNIKLVRQLISREIREYSREFSSREKVDSCDL